METISVTALDIVTSTSDHLLDAANKGAPEGTAFRANVQTKGRGRRGRDWVSPRGNLYVSILLRPTRPMADWPSLSLVAGLALYEAILPFRDAKTLGLKWPNDLLFHDRKAAGLLLEVHDGAILLGCGVNLNLSPDKVEGWPPISLNDDIAESDHLDAETLMDAITKTLPSRYNQWQAESFTALSQDWLQASAHFGQDLAITMQNKTVEGRFTALDPLGSLCLQDSDGVNHVITQGDVTKARLKDQHLNNNG